MTPEEAQELIEKWNKLSKLIDHHTWMKDEYQETIAEMQPIFIALMNAGYILTDDSQWYHPSEAN